MLVEPLFSRIGSSKFSAFMGSKGDWAATTKDSALSLIVSESSYHE